MCRLRFARSKRRAASRRDHDEPIDISLRGTRVTQHLRLSQFVMTYGPGALLEGPQGPRIIPSPETALFARGIPGLTPDALEVSDQRVSQGLLGGARLFRLPSNAEFGIEQHRYLYQTIPFPGWSLCLNNAAHGGQWGTLYNGPNCPVCGQSTRPAIVGQQWQGPRGAIRQQQAIRFVRACADGHLDDVDWFRVVHQAGATCAQPAYFRWYGAGATLAQIRIECAACSASETLGKAYGREWPCSGRHPERETRAGGPQRPGCREAARIIQRQASNLHIPELRTLFTIPPRATRLHHLLQIPTIAGALSSLRTIGQLTETNVRTMVAHLQNQNQVPAATAAAILAHSWPEIEQATNDIFSPVRTSLEDLLAEEFEALLAASVHGAPPVHGQAQGPQSASRVVFQVNHNEVVQVTGPRGTTLRVTPVSRLRTVTAQVGFRREVPRGRSTTANPARVVSTAFADARQQHWFPAVEFLGEGVFVTLDIPGGWHPTLAAPADSWGAAADAVAQHNYSEHLFRGSSRYELHPVFVWWHTLAHLLIRSISIDSGYSSSAIRERVFVDVDDARARARGGVILYATQPGSEGTLGGLIALVPHFQQILHRALEMAGSCSNDPLCGEQHFTSGKYNGAACYGCALVSETSCEHRNLWLDRNLLLANLP